jgi:hypothetical protein
MRTRIVRLRCSNVESTVRSGSFAPPQNHAVLSVTICMNKYR